MIDERMVDNAKFHGYSFSHLTVSLKTVKEKVIGHGTGREAADVKTMLYRNCNESHLPETDW